MHTQPYTKLFGSILNSTVWVGSPIEVKLIWITLMAMSNIDGEVGSTVAGLAKTSELSIKQTEKALAVLSGPDQKSRTKEYLEDGVTLHPLSGRRIVEIEGGWRLVTHPKYRAMMSKEARREYQRTKQAEYRARLDAAKPTRHAVTSHDRGQKPPTTTGAQ